MYFPFHGAKPSIINLSDVRNTCNQKRKQYLKLSSFTYIISTVDHAKYRTSKQKRNEYFKFNFC